MGVPTCPAPGELSDFMAGKVNGDALVLLEEHITTCQNCANVLGSLESDDVYVVAASRADALAAEVASAVVLGVARRAYSLAVTPADEETNFYVPAPGKLPENGDPPAKTPPGKTLGKFQLLGELGHGGMGTVFLARDIVLGREVALKTIRPSLAADTATRDRFLNEARGMARLNHDHVARIFEADVIDETPYFAMERLQGESLGERLRREGVLTTQEALGFAAEVATGLAAVHAAGLIHRDVKPGNIWLEERSEESPRAKVLDFGLVRDREPGHRLTREGDILGTPAFMSPEQVRNESLDGRTDIYSLGCVLYQALTGRLPFEGDFFEVLLSIQTDTPVSVREHNPNVDAEVSDYVNRLLATDPADRPQNANEVATMLRSLSQTSAVLTIPRPSWERSTWRRNVALVLLALPAIGVGSFLILNLLKGGGIAPPPKHPPLPPNPEEVSAVKALPQMSGGAIVSVPEPIGMVKTWTIEPTRQLAPLQFPSPTIQTVPGAGVIALYPNNGSVAEGVTWDTQKHQLVPATRLPFRGQYTQISPDGKVGLRWGVPGAVQRLFGDHNPTRVPGVDGPACFAKDPTQILTKSDSILTIFDLKTCDPIASFRESIQVLLLAWGPEEKHALVLEWGGTVRVYDVKSKAKVNTWSTGVAQSTGAAFSGDGASLALVDTFGNMRCYDSTTGKSRFTHSDAESLYTPIWSGDGKLLTYPGRRAVYPIDGTIKGTTYVVRDGHTGELIATCVGHLKAVVSATFLDDNRTLVTYSQDGTVRFWNPRTGQHLGTVLFLDRDGGNWLMISPTGHIDGPKKTLDHLEDWVSYKAVVNGVAADYTPSKFAEKFGWINDPDRAKVPVPTK